MICLFGCNYRWYVFDKIIFVFIVFNFLGVSDLILVCVLMGINIGVGKVLCGVINLLRWVFVCFFFLINWYLIVGFIFVFLY